MVQILQGDCRDVLKTLRSESVHCVVTSPPFWGLRDYKVENQMGLEETPQAYVAALVDVFREVRRVLRKDGTAWLNLGDCFAGSRRGSQSESERRATGRQSTYPKQGIHGLKPKDLIGIPWRVAFALQEDGWWLRSDIIWAKENPMPESVRDRPTRAHEFIFQLAKGQWKSRVIKFSDLPCESFHLGKYLGLERPDAGANEVCVLLATHIFDRTQLKQDFGLPPFYSEVWKQRPNGDDSDFVRSLPVEDIPAVWSARFLDGDATSEQFLQEIDRLRVALTDRDNLLVSGTATKGLHTPSIDCDGKGTITVHHAGKISKIDFSHHHIVVATPMTCNYFYDSAAIRTEDSGRPSGNGFIRSHRLSYQDRGEERQWEPGRGTNKRDVWHIPVQPYPEAHFATFPEKLVEPCILAGCPREGTVLDPFAGSGTVLKVAIRHGRSAIGIELNPDYIEMIERRVQEVEVALPLEKVRYG